MAWKVDNLTLYWKFDESGGTRAPSQGSTSLTDNNTVGSGVGKLGTAASFVSPNQEFLSAADSAAVSAGDIHICFQAWVKFASGPGDYIIIGKDNDTGRDYVIDYSTVAQRFRFYINGGGGGLLVQSPAAASVGVWYHILAWHDPIANTLNLRVNNGPVQVVSTGGIAPSDTGSQFRIGARQYPSFEGYFDGLIDEVGIWKGAPPSVQDQDDLWNGGAGLALESFGGAAPPPGVSPSGSTSIPAPTSAGTVTVTAPAAVAPVGSTSIPRPTSTGTVTVAAPAAVSVAGATSIPKPTSAATVTVAGPAAVSVAGTTSIPRPVSTGTVTVTAPAGVFVAGVTSIPGPTSAGTMAVSAAGSIAVGGATLLGGPVSSGTVTVAGPAGVAVAGSSVVPAPSSAGTVSVSSPGDVSIAGSVGIPSPLSAGTVTVAAPAGVAPSGLVLLAAPASAGTVGVSAPGSIAPLGRTDVAAPASAGTVTIADPAGVAVSGATSIPGPLSSGSVAVTAPGPVAVSGSTALSSPASAGTVVVSGPGGVAVSGLVSIPPPVSSGTVAVGLGAVGVTAIAAPLSMGTAEIADPGTILVAGSTFIAAPLSGGMIRDDVAVSLGAAIEARVEATPDLADRLPGGFWWGEAGVLGDGTRAVDRPPYGTLDHVGEVYHYDTSDMPKARVDEWMVRFIGPDDAELHAIVGAWHRAFNNRMPRLQVEGERHRGWINIGGQADPSYTPSSTFGYDLGMRMVRCRSFSNI